ncbi:kinase-like domain-containing protein [Dactylonectria estremocensis]|uniref:mitogen-activated protein kinase n=1 Tax=Dactylonectria estremocensis TaxID=1079267 RepID=A0A9P9IQL9_9HYPO|nr:kinase-like domain-containing protein [Dactylonectria estremocensis]
MSDNLKLPDLVRDWELDNTIISDTCTIQASYITDPSKGLWRQRVEEKWERKERIGSGSFGVVWRYECVSGPQIGKVGAVKEMEPGERGASPNENKQLVREISTIVKFSHKQYRDCFVRSFGWYHNQRSIFIVIQYFTLGSLELYIEKPLPEGQTRLISSPNILVQNRGPQWWVKIADFGCSKNTGETLLRSHRVGTPAYLAHQMHPYFLSREDEDDGEYKDDTYTIAVDIWALGAIPFRIATGQLPFKTPPGRDLQLYVSGKPFPVDKSLSNACNLFIASTMAPCPHQRPAAEAALASDWITRPIPVEDSTPYAKPSYSQSTEDEEYSNEWTKVSDTWERNSTVPKVDQTSDTIRREPRETEAVCTEAKPRMFETMRTTKVSGSGFFIYALEVSLDGKWLAAIHNSTKEERSEVVVWAIDNVGHPVHRQGLPEAHAIQLGFTPDSRSLITNDHRDPDPVSFQNRGSLVIWELDVATKTFQRRTEHGYIEKNKLIYASALSSDDQRLILFYKDITRMPESYDVASWKLRSHNPTDEFVESWRRRADSAVEITILCTTGDSRRFLEAQAPWGSTCGKARFRGSDGITELGSESSDLSWARPHWRHSATKFSPDGKWIVVTYGSEKCEYGIDWPKGDPGPRGTLLKGCSMEEVRVLVSDGNPEAQILSIPFSPDSQILATGWDDGNISISNLHGLHFFNFFTKKPFKHKRPVCALAFLSNKPMLVSGSDEGDVMFWNIKGYSTRFW